MDLYKGLYNVILRKKRLKSANVPNYNVKTINEKLQISLNKRDIK